APGVAAASNPHTAYNGPPQHAIDGNTNGNYQAGSTTHTNTEPNPWWEVKLAAATPIERVVIWNRTDGDVGSRLANFRVSLLDDARKVVWQKDVAPSPSPKVELSPSGTQSVSLKQALADHSQQNFAVADVLAPKNPKENGWAIAPHIKAPHHAVFAAASPVSIPAPVLLTFRLEHQFKMPNFTLGHF